MLSFHTLDVFTDRPYAGNPLAVVLGADGLSDAQMQTIAREFNLSETIFVLAPRDPAHTARVRIFFPTGEIPFAGHPTIGCALLLAELAGTPDTVITLEEEAGLVPVTVRQGLAEFVAPVLPFCPDFAPDRGQVAAALDLPETALGPDIGLAEGGPRFLYVPVADLAALARARPIEPVWSALMAAAGVDAAYLYAQGQDCDYRARMFSPTAGIAEDPATGSATALLAARLMAAGALDEGETRLTLHQGVEMGRPSVLRMTAVVQDGRLSQVRVAGQAVRVSEGRLTPP